jgi:hypothetical protein
MIYDTILTTGLCPNCGERVARTVRAIDAHLRAAGIAVDTN